MPSAALRSFPRKDACFAAGQAASWNNVASTNGASGVGAGAGWAKGVVINEFADAGGTGNFVYEFVELHYHC